MKLVINLNPAEVLNIFFKGLFIKSILQIKLQLNPVEANLKCSASTIHTGWIRNGGELFNVFG
jgi:hypothetical protein